MCSYAEHSGNQRDNMCWCFEEISLMLLVQRILMYLWYRLLLKIKHIPSEPPAYEEAIMPYEEDLLEEENFNFNCSDISHVYQSTFLDEYDECLLAEADIAWDMPVPDPKPKDQCQLDEEISLLLNDYYIDDDLDDHLQMAAYETAIGNSFFGDSWME
uniref:Uncharacterized protein n=1 Tax=Anopheles stephensi TaxID=30069 RepID=A0A182Y5J1_ANOST